MPAEKHMPERPAIYLCCKMSTSLTHVLPKPLFHDDHISTAINIHFDGFLSEVNSEIFVTRQLQAFVLSKNDPGTV